MAWLEKRLGKLEHDVPAMTSRAPTEEEGAALRNPPSVLVLWRRASLNGVPVMASQAAYVAGTLLRIASL